MRRLGHRLAVLAVGDELLFGRTVDTNSAWLVRLFSDIGFAVTGIRVVGDHQPEIVAALQAALAEADLVIVSGGLGPTDDDRTRHALAEVMQRPLELNAAALAKITAYWRSRIGRRAMPASNKRQALVPRGARVVANDRGTAPGLLARVGDGWVLCLPGVPHEMEAMAERFVARIDRSFPDLAAPVIAELYTAGLGESTLQDLLGPLADSRRPLVGITASDAGHITVRVVGSASAVQRRIGSIRHRLKAWLLPQEGLAASLVHELSECEWTLTTAESCTCGLLIAAIGAVPGASNVLREGVVTYHNDAKRIRLGVEATALRRHGAVSRQVVEQMAMGGLHTAGADLAIATSGVAGPAGGTRNRPVGTVWLAVATAEGVASRQVQLRGSRATIQRRAVAAALLLAWQVVTGQVAVA